MCKRNIYGSHLSFQFGFQSKIIKKYATSITNPYLKTNIFCFKKSRCQFWIRFEFQNCFWSLFGIELYYQPRYMYLYRKILWPFCDWFIKIRTTTLVKLLLLWFEFLWISLYWELLKLYFLQSAKAKVR